MKSTINISSALLLGAVVLFVGIGTGTLISRDASSVKESVNPPSTTIVDSVNLPDAVSVPENVFDAVAFIPDTSVSFQYPKAGFYGLGAKAVEDSTPDDQFRSIGSVTILPNVPLDQDRLTYLVVLAQGLKSGETLEGAIRGGVVAGFPIGDVETSGSYVNVNGHQYFVFKDVGSTTHAAWHAISFGKNEIVTVLFQSMPGTNGLSFSEFENDDQLFFQILSHVNFN